MGCGSSAREATVPVHNNAKAEEKKVEEKKDEKTEVKKVEEKKVEEKKNEKPTDKPLEKCILIIGAPASGKGTQAEKIKEKYKFLYARIYL